jgi:hypothetical protein
MFGFGESPQPLAQKPGTNACTDHVLAVRSGLVNHVRGLICRPAAYPKPIVYETADGSVSGCYDLAGEDRSDPVLGDR